MSEEARRIPELFGLSETRGGDASELGASDASLLDLVDHLIDKGCVLTGELVLGLADIDLVFVELSLLLCSVDRLHGRREEP